MREKQWKKSSLESLNANIENLDEKFDGKFHSLEESQRKTGVLLEEMNGKLSLLIEGYIGHDGRLVHLEERMEKLEKRTDEGFMEIDYKFEHVFEKLDAIEGRLDRHQVPRF